MSKTALRCSAALIAVVFVAMRAGAQESAIPNFTSANFGWLVNSGFDFRPIKGKAAPVGGPDPYWRGGIGLPTSDFNYQPPEAAADPRRQGPNRIGPWNSLMIGHHFSASVFTSAPSACGVCRSRENIS
jgi:hypothetical protein